MKIELFNNKGVFQPIEFILATIVIGVTTLLLLGAMYTLDSYLPWWNESRDVLNNTVCIFLVVFVLNCIRK